MYIYIYIYIYIYVHIYLLCRICLYLVYKLRLCCLQHGEYVNMYMFYYLGGGKQLR